MSFTQKEDELLLEAVREQPALYNLTNKNYKNTIYKNQIWYNIATSLNKSIKAVKARWKSVRGTYNKRRKRLGTGSPRCSKKPWSLEAHLAFLKTVKNERKSTSNVTPDTDNVEDTVKRKYEDIVKRKYEDIDDNEDDYNNIDDEDNIDELIGGDDQNNEKPIEIAEMMKPCPKKIKNDDRHLSTSSVSSAGSACSRESKPDDLAAEEKVKLYRSLQTDISLDLFFESLCAQVKELPPHLVPDIRIKMIQMICELEKSYKFDPSKQPQQHQNLNNTPYFQSQRVELPLMSSSSTSTDSSEECVTYTFV
ncbi:uncharacterized protein LOC122849589 [Aphidius gifuensis]|uniref:uncharacterized protein LOC122849589 n=1 Tax=Aphidius gifuensis TaxID=684658 RepID=UPI001CDB7B90|nr:uncharacterized protein LOC122849589 [Aphidius gifuensis]